MRFLQAQLFLLSVIVHDTLALKGGPSLRGESNRSLQVMKSEPTTEGMMTPKVQPGEVSGPAGAEVMAPKEPKAPPGEATFGATSKESAVKADGMQGPKEHKEKEKEKKAIDKKKDKKCKKPKGFKRRRAQVDKAPKIDGPGTVKEVMVPKMDKESPVMEPAFSPYKSDAEEPDEEPFCLQAALSEEQCAALRNGEPANDDKTANGILVMELSYNTDSKDTADMATNVLRAETPSKFAGCSSTFRKLLTEGAEETLMSTNDEGIDLYVSGLKFGKFIVSSGACKSVSENAKCDVIESDVDIHYSGKDASQNEKDEMFAMLKEIIESQDASGSFSHAGSIQSVEAISSEGSGRPPAGMPIGVVVATLAVLGVAGCCYYRSRNRFLTVNEGPSSSNKEENHHTDDSSNEGDGIRDQEPIEVHATLIDHIKDKVSGDKQK